MEKTIQEIIKTLDFSDYDFNINVFNQINLKIVKELLKLKKDSTIKIIFKDGEIILKKIGGSYDLL